MPKGTFWTKEDDALLRQLCAQNLSHSEIAERMGIAKNTVSRHRVALGLSTNPRAGEWYMPGAKSPAKTWPKEDIETLERMVQAGHSPDEILPHLTVKRSVKSVADKIYKMGWRLAGKAPRKVEKTYPVGKGNDPMHATDMTIAYADWRKEFREKHPPSHPHVIESDFIKPISLSRLMAGR